MIKIAFCDDDMEVLHQMNELLDRYRVERNEDITYAAFQSPFGPSGLSIGQRRP